MYLPLCSQRLCIIGRSGFDNKSMSPSQLWDLVVVVQSISPIFPHANVNSLLSDRLRIRKQMFGILKNTLENKLTISNWQNFKFTLKRKYPHWWFLRTILFRAGITWITEHLNCIVYTSKVTWRLLPVVYNINNETCECVTFYLSAVVVYFKDLIKIIGCILDSKI